MIVAIATALILLIFWVARELQLSEYRDLSLVLLVMKQSYAGCVLAGFMAGIAFGVPLGIVHVLSLRESRLHSEQELDMIEDTGDDSPGT